MEELDKTSILLKFSEVELEWLRWAVMDAQTRGVEERLIRERLWQRIEKAIGIKSINEVE